LFNQIKHFLNHAAKNAGTMWGVRGSMWGVRGSW